MSNNVRMTTKLPADERWNGLDDTLQDLVNDPLAVRVGLVRYDVVKIVDDPETGVRVPHIRVRGFEPVGTVGDIAQVLTDHLNEAIRKRTNQDPLPLDVVETVDDGVPAGYVESGLGEDD